MGICVLVLGASGSGKSTSLRNFEPREVGVLNVLGKPLPFRKRLDSMDHVGYARIRDVIVSGKRRAWVIDDAGYLMANENFARARETGYGKYTDMALNFQQLLNAATMAPPDTITYLMMHAETDQFGHETPKTVGRMLDEKYCIDILTQISALNSALKSVSLALLDDHLRHCVVSAAQDGGDELDVKLEEASDAIRRLAK